MRASEKESKNVSADHTTCTEPVTFVIQVRGVLDQSWSDRLGGMAVVDCGADDTPETTLIGALPDQAALYGVLMTLYHNRLPLLSLRSLPPR